MKNLIYVLVILILFGVASYFIYKTVKPVQLPSNLIAGTGRIDGDLIFLNAKYAGRVQDIFFNDGDNVKKGQVVAVLTSEELQARLQATENSIEALKASTDAARLGYEQSIRDFKRIEKLYENELISKSDYENAMLAMDSNEKQLENFNSQIKQLGSQREEIISMLKEMKIIAPIDGVVIDRIAQPGMVIGDGGNIMLLIDPEELYLKLFIDTIENGRIKIGDKASIFLDAYPDKPIQAKVIRIEQRAEFTPKEVQIKSDRIQLMFAVHIKPIEANPLIKLGLPAIGVISIDGKGLPESSRFLGDL